MSEEHAGIRVVAVLGLGEAGSTIGRDLVAAGVTVRGYDPAVAAFLIDSTQPPQNLRC